MAEELRPGGVTGGQPLEEQDDGLYLMPCPICSVLHLAGLQHMECCGGRELLSECEPCDVVMSWRAHHRSCPVSEGPVKL